jgi:hypothetical protein
VVWRRLPFDQEPHVTELQGCMEQLMGVISCALPVAQGICDHSNPRCSHEAAQAMLSDITDLDMLKALLEVPAR